MKTFDKDGVLGAWEGDRGLVVWVKGGNDGDAPVKHHIQHPLTPRPLFAQFRFLANQRLWLLSFLGHLSQRENAMRIFECTT